MNATELQAWETRLVDTYNAYCEQHGLTLCSADELHYDILCKVSDGDDTAENAAHLEWLSAFINEWEQWEKASDVPYTIQATASVGI